MHEQTDEISHHAPVPFPDFIYRYCFAELRRSNCLPAELKSFIPTVADFFQIFAFLEDQNSKTSDGWLVTETVARTPAFASHDPAARLRPANRRRSAGSRPAGDNTGRVRDTVGSSAALRTRQKSAGAYPFPSASSGDTHARVHATGDHPRTRRAGAHG